MRKEDFLAVAGLVADYLSERADVPVTPCLGKDEISCRIDRLLTSAPRGAAEAAADVLELLGSGNVRTDSPRYFGLFNPPALPEAIIGDWIASAANPQLAVWSHAPAAAAIEERLVRLFGELAGWNAEDCAGHFTTGGSEANHTALLAAMARKYPDWSRLGIAGLGARPALFVSEEAHLAWVKIARAAGLGSEAVRLVPADEKLRLTGDRVRNAIEASPEWDPVLVAATAGATAHGAVDDLAGLAAVARDQGAHFHIDAAWAGAGLFVARGLQSLAGLALADSITIDPHKALCVPMGAGLFLSRGWEPLEKAFEVTTSYMPPRSTGERDAYVHSLQWSRRSIGLRLLTVLAIGGRAAIAERLDRQFDMGERLRERLLAEDWDIVNSTPFPLVCARPRGNDSTVPEIVRRVTGTGRAWISVAQVKSRPAVRACITSYDTHPDDVDELVRLLGEARSAQSRDGSR